MPQEIALCHVIKDGSILLIKADEGISKGKWNAPNCKIEQGEKPAKAAIREVYQQSGIYVGKIVEHGTIRLYLNGKTVYDYRLHVYSSKSFSGDIKPNLKGEAKWFDIKDIPYYDMWADDKYWINYVLQGKKFDADFFFDEKNEKIVKYQIKERQQILQKAFPAVVVIAVIALIIFGIAKSGLLKALATPSNSIPRNSIALTKSTATTTIAAGTTTTIISTSQIPPAGSTPPTNQTLFYVGINSGNPATTRIYYANWTQTGTPLTINNAECTIYKTYMYCVSLPKNATVMAATSASASNSVSGGQTGTPVLTSVPPGCILYIYPNRYYCPKNDTFVTVTSA